MQVFLHEGHYIPSRDSYGAGVTHGGMKVRKETGYECAGATLGHTNMSATAIYAERNQGLADEAAKRFG